MANEHNQSKSSAANDLLGTGHGLWEAEPGKAREAGGGRSAKAKANTSTRADRLDDVADGYVSYGVTLAVVDGLKAETLGD